MSSETSEHLYNALQVMRSKWAFTKALWYDLVASHFETTYFHVLEHQAEKTLTEMSELTKVVAEARKKVH